MGIYVHTCFSVVRTAVVRASAVTLLVLIAASAAHAQYAVTATWDRNTDTQTRGYRLYYGTAPGTYQWSVDVGNQVSAPLNLSSGRYYLAVRAYNASFEYGPPSSEVTFVVGTTTTPAPTAAIQASLQGTNTALVSWQTTNAVSASINGTAVPTSGSTTIAVSATTTFTITARSASGATATASATVTVGGTGGTTNTAPLAPVNMASSVSGSNVTLRWQRNPSGSAPTNYLLYVGTYSWGANVVYKRSLGNVLTVSAPLPPGTYYARVRAVNAYGVSYSSNQVSFRVGTQLASPTGFRADWSGTTATLRWGASAADSPDTVPSDYVLEAGSGPGLADLATIPVGSATTFQANIPAGVYFVRVRAVNPRGDSNPSNEIVVAPPGTAAAPRTLAAGGSGSTVTLTWALPQGETPAGYVIEAGSDPGWADLARIQVGNVTTFTTEAPPGVYFVRVRAVNAMGPGLPSNEVVVQK